MIIMSLLLLYCSLLFIIYCYQRFSYIQKYNGTIEQKSITNFIFYFLNNMKKIYDYIPELLNHNYPTEIQKQFSTQVPGKFKK